MKTKSLINQIRNLKLSLALVSIQLIFTIGSIYAQNTWSQSNLSTTCQRMGVASLGSKVYFAGGTRGINNQTSNIIDIYDVNTQSWSVDSLSVARDFAVGVSVGSKVIFAGGNNFLTYTPSSQVDIYDTITQQWTTAQLSQPRFNIAAVSYGNEVLFAGGASQIANTSYSIVDKYNATTGTWSTTTLSSARCGMGYAVADGKAYFAGGYDLSTGQIYNVIDIYDFNTGTWSTASLSLARCFLSAAVAGNKILFAGGMVSTFSATEQVDIYDIPSGNWSTSNLFFQRAFYDNSASACGKAFFGAGGKFNLSSQSWSFIADEVSIYDSYTGQWTYDHLSNPSVNNGVIANGNQVFFAGGSSPFANDTVDIYTCSPTGLNELSANGPFFNVYPNPSSDLLILSSPLFNGSDISITINDVTGKEIYAKSMNPSQNVEIDVNEFAEGVYLVQMQSAGVASTKIFMVSK